MTPQEQEQMDFLAFKCRVYEDQIQDLERELHRTVIAFQKIVEVCGENIHFIPPEKTIYGIIVDAIGEEKLTPPRREGGSR